MDPKGFFLICPLFDWKIMECCLGFRNHVFFVRFLRRKEWVAFSFIRGHSNPNFFSIFCFLFFLYGRTQLFFFFLIKI